jgi:threonine/homoserine/homoserine lactone efflux protein
MVALVSLVVLTSFGLSQSFFMGLSFIGAGILIWISWSIWKVRRIDTEEKVYFGLGKISVMILANGVLWTFWITVCVPKAILLSQKVHYGQFLFLLLVEIGWLISTVTVALVFSSFRKLLSNPRVVPIIFKLFSLVFLYFAVSMIYQSINFFINK